MDKSQALYSFWSGFSLPAYDENTVPDNATMPYVTYETATANLGKVVNLTASLYYKSMSWEAISKKADEIARHIGQYMEMKLDDGYVWIVQGEPFSQRMAEQDDDTIRRIVLNIQAEFLTAD